MRVIKFRGWDHGTNAWHNFNANDFSFNPTPPLDALFLTSLDGQCNLEQFTGLLDKNDVEIYEGDILFCSVEKMIGTVKFTSGCFTTDCSGWGDECLNGIDTDHIEIVGNIHENPELLEAT